MRNRRPVIFWVIAGLVVFIFLILTAQAALNYRYFFSSVDSAVVNGNTVWGVCSEGEEMTIFHVSADTGIGDFMKIPMIEHERIVTVCDPFISDGRVFFHKTLCADDGTYTEELVSWNLEKNKLVTVKNPNSVLKNLKSENGENQVSGILDRHDEGENTLYELVPTTEEEKKGAGDVLLCIRKEGKDRLIKGVQRESGKIVRNVVFYFLGALLLLAILMIASNLATYYRVYLGIWFRMGFMTLVMIAVLVFLFSDYFNQNMYAFTIDHVMYHCSDFAYIRSFSVNDEVINTLINKQEEPSAELLKDIWKYDLDDSIVTDDLNEEKTSSWGFGRNRKAWDLYDDYVIDEESCIIYRQKGEYGILCDEKSTDIPWLKDNHPAEWLHMEQAFSEDATGSFITSTGKQRYAVSFTPVELESGTKVVVGTRIPLNNALLRCKDTMSGIIKTALILTLCLIILFIAVITHSLWPIKSLKEAVRSITAGDLSVRAKTGGRGELDYLARLFNVMADRLSAQSSGTDSYRYFYEAFLPASLLQSMSYRSVSGALRPEAVYRADGYSLVMNVQGVGASKEEKNRFFETAVRTAQKYGGHPLELDDKRIKLIGIESSEAALRVATSIQQSLAENQKDFAWAGMASCEVRLCVIGTDSRKNVIEQDSYEAEILSEIAADLRIPVILTEDLYLDVMHKTAKFQFRCIGRISKNGYEPDAPLYELLDADNASFKAIKRYSRTVFEQGVSAYASGNYFKARNEMIKALELDPDDLVARCYILNCDRKEPPKVCQAMKQVN